MNKQTPQLCIFNLTLYFRGMKPIIEDLGKLISKMPKWYGSRSLNEIQVTCREYEKILSKVNGLSDEYNRNTFYYLDELRDIKGKLSTAECGKTKKAKETAFDDARRGLLLDIEALIGLIKRVEQLD